jgi:hypothetical protein
VLTALFDEEPLDETAWGYGYKEGYCDDQMPYAMGTSFTDSFCDEYGGKSWGWYFYGCED